MDSLNEKEIRNIFACVVRITKSREPIVKIFQNSRGWSKSALKTASLENLLGKFEWILEKSSLENILLLEKYKWLNREPFNSIAVKVLKRRHFYNDDRFNNLITKKISKSISRKV